MKFFHTKGKYGMAMIISIALLLQIFVPIISDYVSATEGSEQGIEEIPEDTIEVGGPEQEAPVDTNKEAGGKGSSLDGEAISPDPENPVEGTGGEKQIKRTKKTEK